MHFNEGRKTRFIIGLVGKYNTSFDELDSLSEEELRAKQSVAETIQFLADAVFTAYEEVRGDERTEAIRRAKESFVTMITGEAIMHAAEPPVSEPKAKLQKRDAGDDFADFIGEARKKKAKKPSVETHAQKQPLMSDEAMRGIADGVANDIAEVIARWRADRTRHRGDGDVRDGGAGRRY